MSDTRNKSFLLSRAKVLAKDNDSILLTAFLDSCQDDDVCAEAALALSSHSIDMLPIAVSRIKNEQTKSKVMTALLARSCENGDIEAFWTIVRHTNPSHVFSLLSLPSTNGCSAIALSVTSGSIGRILSSLDKRSYESLLSPPFNVRIPLMVAVEMNDIETARYLIGLVPESIHKSYNGRSCLDTAITNRSDSMIDLLVSKGCDTSKYVAVACSNPISAFSMEDLYLHAAVLSGGSISHRMGSGGVMDGWCQACIIYRMALICSSMQNLVRDDSSVITYSPSCKINAFIPLLEKINPHFVHNTLQDNSLIEKARLVIETIPAALQNLVDHLIYTRTSKHDLFGEAFLSSFSAGNSAINQRALVSTCVLWLFFLHESSNHTKHIEDYSMMNIIKHTNYENVGEVIRFISLCQSLKTGKTPLLEGAMDHCCELVIGARSKGGEEYDTISRDKDFCFIALKCLISPKSPYSFGCDKSEENIIKSMYGTGECEILFSDSEYAYHKVLIKSLAPILHDTMSEFGARSVLPIIKHVYGEPLTSALKDKRGEERTLAFILDSHTDSSEPIGRVYIDELTPEPLSRHVLVLGSRCSELCGESIECYLFDLIIEALVCDMHSLIDEALLLIKPHIGTILLNETLTAHTSIFMRLLLENSHNLTALVSRESVDVIRAFSKGGNQSPKPVNQ